MEGAYSLAAAAIAGTCAILLLALHAPLARALQGAAREARRSVLLGACGLALLSLAGVLRAIRAAPEIAAVSTAAGALLLAIAAYLGTIRPSEAR